MPNGQVQTDFKDTLLAIGGWLTEHGETIYGTRGNIIEPQKWGVLTAKGKRYFAHVLNTDSGPCIFIQGFKEKISSVTGFITQNKLKTNHQPEGLFVYLAGLGNDRIHRIVEIDIE